MTKLPHTHASSGDCLACDVRHVRAWLYPYRPEITVDEALDRIEAALAEREHLAFAADCLFAIVTHPNLSWQLEEPMQRWLEAERARKGQT